MRCLRFGPSMETTSSKLMLVVVAAAVVAGAGVCGPSILQVDNSNDYQILQLNIRAKMRQ